MPDEETLFIPETETETAGYDLTLSSLWRMRKWYGHLQHEVLQPYCPDVQKTTVKQSVNHNRSPTPKILPLEQLETI